MKSDKTQKNNPAQPRGSPTNHIPSILSILSYKTNIHVIENRVQGTGLPAEEPIHMIGTKMDLMTDVCTEFFKHGGDWSPGVNPHSGREYLIISFSICMFVFCHSVLKHYRYSERVPPTKDQ